MIFPTLKKDFNKSAVVLMMTVMGLNTLGAAIPTDAHAGGNGQGFHIGVKGLYTGDAKFGGGGGGSSHESAANAGEYKPVTIDHVPDFISGHAAASDHTENLHTSPAQKYYKASDVGHESPADSGHGGKSSKDKYSDNPMLSVVFGHNGHYGDVSGFSDFIVEGSKLKLYEIRGTLFLSGEKLTGRDFSMGPVSDVGLMARIEHAHTPVHGESSIRYGFGPAVDLADGHLRVGALVRDDVSQPGVTGQIAATWEVPVTIAGKDVLFTGRADGVGPEGNSAAHAVIKQEVWVPVYKKAAYVGGHVKAMINKDGVAGHHDVQAGIGIKIGF